MERRRLLQAHPLEQFPLFINKKQKHASETPSSQRSAQNHIHTDNISQRSASNLTWPEVFKETHHTAANGLVAGEFLLAREKPSSSQRTV